jgi:hypothetical protein
MKNKLPMLLLGCLIGAGLVQTIHVANARKSAGVFGQRLKCKDLAENYQKENSDEYRQIILIRVDFSPVRNSCVAAVEEISTAVSRQNRYDHFKVIDLVSGQGLFRETCREGRDAVGQSDYCGNGKNSAMARARDEFLDRELKSSWW